MNLSVFMHKKIKTGFPSCGALSYHNMSHCKLFKKKKDYAK